jgi:hypothetical protein
MAARNCGFGACFVQTMLQILLEQFALLLLDE